LHEYPGQVSDLPRCFLAGYNAHMNSVLAERVLPASQKMQIVRGDITEETTDAIVNAANEQLRHGAGVAGAIVRGGGAPIQQESDTWVREHGPVSHAKPAWTGAGRLKSKYVIHAVGPIWGEGEEDAKLAAAVQGVLETADELKLESIAMPALSTGIFGFPKERAAGVMFRTMRRYFSHHETRLKLVRVVLFDKATIEAFMSVWDALPDE
jgi:putative ATPase